MTVYVMPEMELPEGDDPEEADDREKDSDLDRIPRET